MPKIIAMIIPEYNEILPISAQAVLGKSLLIP
jgi:hypothetical protein